jgi:hypothetical protein
VDSNNLLDIRRDESKILLQRVVESLEADERVAAAWLFGSHGRGDADDLSDIDLWVVVEDKYIGELVAKRREYVARPGEPLLMVEAPQNAPTGGGYLLALYEGEAGPHQIDWYWQPQSQARIPQQVAILFNRANIPHAEQAPPQSTEEVARIASEKVAFFWAMCDIAAKKIARRQSWAATRMLSMLGQTLDEVVWLAGVRDGQPGFGYEGVVPPPVQPAEQLALLQKMVREMASLLPAISAIGGVVPSDKAASQICNFLALADVLVNKDPTASKP